MNWKQFLKPDKRKIILTVFGIIILIATIVSNSHFGCSSVPCADFSGYFGFGLPGGGSCCSESLLNFSAFIITLIISYFVSCLVIWTRDKKILRNWVWIIVAFIIMFFILYVFTIYIASFVHLYNPFVNATVSESVMAMQFRIEDAKYYTGGWVIATIRNTGIVGIATEKLGIYVDGSLSTLNSVTPSGIISPGTTTTINITNATYACPNKTLKVTVEGWEDNRIIIC